MKKFYVFWIYVEKKEFAPEYAPLPPPLPFSTALY